MINFSDDNGVFCGIDLFFLSLFISLGDIDLLKFPYILDPVSSDFTFTWVPLGNATPYRVGKFRRYTCNKEVNV